MGGRFPYVFAAGLLVVAVVAVPVRQGAGHVFLRYMAPTATPLILMVGELMLYNAARFESPFDFGLTRSVSRYEDYMHSGHYWSLDHVLCNLWDHVARLPAPVSHFPCLGATITMSEVTRRSATPIPPYHLVHVTELTASAP